MLIPVVANQSLQTLVRQALGSVDTATLDTIITANGLQWPYLVPFGTDLTTPASGSVTLTWSTNTPLTIPAGTLVEAPLADHGGSRQYALETAVTFVGPGTQTAPITATIGGSFGNAPPASVTVCPAFPTLICTNAAAITGGSILHCLQPGDLLWIPDPAGSATSPQSPTSLAAQEAQGETDIHLTPQGGMRWGATDLQLTTGATTILQDGASRIRTPLNTLSWAPGQGSLVPGAIGEPTSTLLHKVGVLTVQALMQDPRLGSVQVDVHQDPANASILNATVTSQLLNQSIQTSLT